MRSCELQSLLDEKYHKYNTPEFIISDPVSIPHKFSLKANIEISGFLAAMLAWGQRTTIIGKAETLVRLMDNDPYNFLMNATGPDYKEISAFVHRTFNGGDAVYFIQSLANIYKNHGGLEKVFSSKYAETGEIKSCLAHFRKVFFELPHLLRTEKHVANIEKGASAKRLNMFLRWMVRKDTCGVDFGIWPRIDMSALYIPLDLHTGNMARILGLLKRKQNDWRAVEELNEVLQKFDPSDPVKYDFALFGMGRYEYNDFI